MIRHNEEVTRVQRAMAGQAELEAVGCCLVDANAVDVLVGIVEPRHFGNDRARVVYEAILKLSSVGSFISAEEVAHLVSDKGVSADDLVKMLQCVPHGYHVDSYGRRVLEAWKRRQLRYEMAAAVTTSQESAADIDEVLQDTIRKLETTLENGATDEHDGHIEEHLLRLARTPTPQRFSTGIPNLDHVLSGGFTPGQLVCLGARPAVGKSALCGQIALSIATSGVPALLLSFEMSDFEMTKRFLAQSGASLADVESARRLAAQPLMSRAAGGWSIDRVECEVRRYVRKYGVKLVVVDYLSLVRPRDSRLQRYEQIGDISRSLKQLALRNEITVLAAQQLSRELEKRDDRRPRMSDFRESGSIEQDSDILLGLERAVRPDQGDITNATLCVMKHRQGTTGDLTLRFDPARTRFDELWPQAAGVIP